MQKSYGPSCQVFSEKEITSDALLLRFRRHERSKLDYTGRILPTPEEAYDAAELMALDLFVRREDETIGWAVKMSSAEGRKLFSIPVQASYQAAVQMAA
jgi:hypothetical protein